MKLIIGLLSFSLVGCFVAINENSYRTLDARSLEHFVDFDLTTVGQTSVDNQTDLRIYEISTPEFKKSFEKAEYTWIHLWQAFCPNDYCQNIAVYEDYLEELSENHDINFLMVSNTYDLKHIANAAKNAKFNLPIYVLKDAYYGHKVRPAKLKALEEFGIDISDKNAIVFDDLLFRNGDLIHYGYKLSGHDVDSVLNAR
ncbi:MAG: hypothetical protein KDC92_13490 [Bacteroidetes bacterium]|nr:hypothetical protein [Bacteroidota bacterium]